MKTLQFFIATFLLSICGFSQDTIFTKNGDMIGSKVMEINQDEIKYKKSSNPDGPLYVIKKSDVTLIEYQNGSRDVFASNSRNTANNTDNGNTGNNNNSTSDPVYVNQRPPVNVVIGAMPFLSLGTWGWGWGWGNGWYGAGWGRSWGWGHRGWSYSHHGGRRHFGHYGRRGGGHR